DYTFIPGDNGVHTFTNGVTLVTPGAQTVTATDTGNGTINGTSNTINVSAVTAATVVGVTAKWGTVGSIALVDASGGRLLPSGRTNDLPWFGINRMGFVLSQSATLSPADVTV